MLFQKNIIKKYLATLPLEVTGRAWNQYKSYFLNPDIQSNIQQSKEEQFQEGFLRELFVKVLGYTLNPSPDYNLITEQKNETNSKKADGAILLDGKVIGIIELKDHKTTDLSKIEQQAFGYKSQHRDARYVIISNFEKLRLYIDNAVDFREWNLFAMTEDEFNELYLCIAWTQVKKGVALKVKSESVSSEDKVTQQLYKDYSAFKREIFADIVANNTDENTPKEHILLLFKKTQKLLDRLLFIFFAEDCGLLPPNSMIMILDQWEQLKELDEAVPLYSRIKKYFGYLDTGFQGKKYEIFAYNGGLFKPDEILDGLKISDELLARFTRRLSEYDYASEVDVNILGHIFENSLNEIEEVTAQINSGEKAPAVSKRKRDGVFYTPQYITKYIVENTVGRLCAEKKSEMGIDEAEYFADKNRQMATKKRLMKKLQAYREWLLGITICDPACGSGAFLNAALAFLINEHKLIDEMETKVTGGSIVFQNVENSILENNLYGVDINEESVEIAQLALWLRTAKPHRKLNTLSQNIKCGNSLVSDPAIAGDKAFNWQEQFPKVFRKKQKRAWHITTATHDSRTSQRMIDYKVRLLRDHGMRPYADPMWLDPMEEKIVTETVAEIVKADGLNVLAYNVCGDHMHLVLVCEEEEVPKIVGKIKSMTARAVNIAMGRTTAGHAPLSERDDDAPTDSGTAGHAPLSEKPTRGETQCSLWTRKFGCVELDSAEYLYNAIEYVKNNRKKHGLPPLWSDETAGSGAANRGACPPVTACPPVEDGRYPATGGRVCAVPTVSVEEAFRPEYDGGFDVVIGNPPYVRADSPGNSLDFRNYMTSCGKWETLGGKWDLYIPFLELSIKISKPNSLCSFIIPDAYCHAEYGKRSLEYIKSNHYLSMIDYFPDIEVFENVGVKNVIVNFDKHGVGCFIQRIHDANHQFVEKISDCYPENLRIDAKKRLLAGKDGMVPLENVCYMSVGIVGNSDEKQYNGEFLVGDLLSDVKDEVHCKLYYEGKDISVWQLSRRRYIEYGTERSPKKWRRKGFTEMFEGSPKLATMRSPGAFPRTFLDTENGYFNESAIGFKRWIDLKGVDNNSVSKAYDDKTERALFEDISANYSYKALLAIFNSSLIRYELNTERRSNIHIYPDDWKRLVIPKVTAENLVTIESLADTMLTLNADLQQKRSRFLRRLQDNLVADIGTATEGRAPRLTALQNFDQMDFAHFLKELKKQKIKLTLPQQDEWEDYFGQYKTECNRISEQITETDRKIDGMVYELYGLTEEEIEVVEGK